LVPIIPVAFDFGKKEVRIATPLIPSGNFEVDMKEILPFYKNVKGRIPHQGFEV